MTSAQSIRSELELRDYFALVRRQWILIVAITIAVVGVAMTYSLTRPATYEATANVLLDTGFSRTVLFADNDNVPSIDEQVTTESDLMRTQEVRDGIEERLGYLPEVEAAARDIDNAEAKTRAIEVTASASSPQEAAKQADDFAKRYIDVRKVLIDNDLQANIEENRVLLTRLDEQAARTAQRLRELDTLIPTVSGEEQDVLIAERTRLQFQIDNGSIAARQTQINSRIDLLQTAVANNAGRGIFKFTKARVPTAPASPTPRRDGLIALLVGLSLGLLAAFSRDYYDDTLRTKDDLDQLTGGLPVLSLVPKVGGRRDKEGIRLEALTNPRSGPAEAYRTLRTALEFAAIEHKVGIIHITSSLPGEGKTTTAANLAVSLASADQTVVLVDCDLRRPQIHSFFDLSNDVGLTDVLRGDIMVQDALQACPGAPNLHVLTSGAIPPNPSELLSSGATRKLLETLDRFADHVVIDSPPLLPVADASILASYADSTILVVSAHSTTRRAIGRSLEILAQVNAPLEGLVFNQVGAEATYTYTYD